MTGNVFDLRIVGILLALNSLLFLSTDGNNDEALVNVPQLGKIRGFQMTTTRNREFLAFTGIPYAEPPTGNLRFKPPISKSPWVDSPNPLDATKDSPYCIQYNYISDQVFGTEDCLFLNVYTHKTLSSEKKPVMIFIHGGGLTFGSGNMRTYGPRKLLDRDVVLVTMNYRLHAFGFLSTADGHSPGNYGLLDQLEAMKWVKKNIGAFGGDADKITILGNSAGSVSVYYHLLSPLSKGLFSAAVPMSGSPLACWGYMNNPLSWAKKLSAIVDCPVDDSSSIVNCLKDKPAEIITAALKTLTEFVFTPFGPVVDNHFLLDEPRNLFEKGKFSKVPILTGVNSAEGIFETAMPLGPGGKSYSLDDFDRILAVASFSNPREVSKLSPVIKKWYLDKHRGKSDTEIITQVFSDSMFDTPHYETIDFLLESGMKPYVYSYDYSGKFNVGKLFGLKDISGVCHGEELYILFDGDTYFPAFKDVDDFGTYQFLDYWVNFATYRNPMPLEKVTEEMPSWTPAEKGKVLIYHLNKTVSVENYDLKADGRINLWMNTVPSALAVVKKDYVIENNTSLWGRFKNFMISLFQFLNCKFLL